MTKCVCPYCSENKGFNTGGEVGQLTCSNCKKTFDVDKLVEIES